jgi:two-component system LytT family sensor kinase
MKRRTQFALIFGAYTGIGLLWFFYRYMNFVVREEHVSPWIPLIEELTGAYGGAVLFPAVVYFARRNRFHRDSWFTTALRHLAAIVVFSTIKTSLLWGSRVLLFPVFGFGHYDYGLMPLRYAMEFPGDITGYATVITAIYLFDNYRSLRDREVQLAEAQLQNLRLQLQPHFLFNALNTISSVMYEDPRSADMMLSRLSDLLRLTLKNSRSQEVRLTEELECLDSYLKIMQARFEERLTVDFQVESGTEAAMVPQLILQPLVENSIRYGAHPESAEIRVSISASRSNGSLILQVRDMGPGLGSPAPLWGIGLSNTKDRLLHLYGDRQGISLENATDGGLRVTLEMPFRS